MLPLLETLTIVYYITIKQTGRTKFLFNNLYPTRTGLQSRRNSFANDSLQIVTASGSITLSTLKSLEGSPQNIQSIIESLEVSEFEEDITMVPLPSPRQYPLHNERDAPKFDGTGRSNREIERHMEDIETLVGQCEDNVTNTILIQKVKYYCSTDIEEQFGSISQDSWNNFRKEAIAM